MGRHAQIVMGPAGSGKSTYCHYMQQHAAACKRSLRVVNFDPAAEEFKYEVAFDIRDLVSLEDVMEELNLGPNGGLVHCMEYLCDNLDWLQEELDAFDDDYLIFDFPGQIEIYSHIPVVRRVVDAMATWGFSACGVYVVDSQFIDDPAKFISATLCCLSAMVTLELPHVNVLSKMDLLSKSQLKKIDSYLDPDVDRLVGKLNATSHPRFAHLNEAVGSLVEEYNMVNFIPLDLSDPDSCGALLAQIDNAIQFGEDVEPKEPVDPDADDEERQQAAGEVDF